MVLSDTDLKKFIDSGDITINPLDETLIKPGSYTFTLGTTLFKPVTKGEIDTKTTEVEYQEINIDEKGYLLEPGEFILGQTFEKLSVSKKVGCILDNKTSLARIGVNMILGSTFIEPGQTDSHETLEITNLSQNPVRIYAGMKVVKGIFFLLSSEANISYAEVGTYARQSKPNVKLRK